MAVESDKSDEIGTKEHPDLEGSWRFASCQDESKESGQSLYQDRSGFFEPLLS